MPSRRDRIGHSGRDAVEMLDLLVDLNALLTHSCPIFKEDGSAAD
jgi:hypothetical protein